MQITGLKKDQKRNETPEQLLGVMLLYSAAIHHSDTVITTSE